MSQRSREENSIQSMEEDLQNMTLAHSLAAQHQKNGDGFKTPLARESMLRAPEERKATKDDPKDKNLSTTGAYSRPRPDLEHPISSTPSDETFSLLPSTVWVITQTRVVHSTLRTLCLCTSFSISKTVLYCLRDEFSSRPSLHIPERTKRVLRKYRVLHDHGDSEKEEKWFGFEALMDEAEDVLYHVKGSRAEGKNWQEKIADGRVFGEGSRRSLWRILGGC